MLSRLGLNQKLTAGGLTVLFLSAAISIALIAGIANNYWQARKNLHSLTLYQQILTAGNRISAERGPSNSVLGENLNADAMAAHERLESFRNKTDAALHDILLNVDDYGVDAGVITRLQDQLAAARKRTDRVAALPKSQRSSRDIAGAIHAMFEVVEALRPVTTSAINRMVAQDKSLAAPAMMAEILADLRDQVGRYSSYLMPYIVTADPLTDEALSDISMTRGRIFTLWQLAQDEVGFRDGNAQLVEVSRQAAAKFFSTGIPIVDAIIEEGRSGKHYSLTTKELTDLYVPSFLPIENLRTTFLATSFSDAIATRDRAFFWLVTVLAITTIIIVDHIAIIWAVQTGIFRPLLAACQQIIALAEAGHVEDIAIPKGAHEFGRLYDSLQVLKRRLAERSLMAARLKEQADTDALTGLLNRRALDRYCEDIALLGAGMKIGFILLDIDHFKSVNDNHGHQAGDKVLRSVAHLIRTNVRQTCIVARYGGEEIAIVVPNDESHETSVIAERLRSTMEHSRIDLESGIKLQVTASFGVALGGCESLNWVNIFAEADEALYKAKASGRNKVVVSDRPKKPAADIAYTRGTLQEPLSSENLSSHRSLWRFDVIAKITWSMQSLVCFVLDVFCADRSCAGASEYDCS